MLYLYKRITVLLNVLTQLAPVNRFDESLVAYAKS